MFEKMEPEKKKRLKKALTVIAIAATFFLVQSLVDDYLKDCAGMKILAIGYFSLVIVCFWIIREERKTSNKYFYYTFLLLSMFSLIQWMHLTIRECIGG
jgi:hypothetical protein